MGLREEHIEQFRRQLDYFYNVTGIPSAILSAEGDVLASVGFSPGMELRRRKIRELREPEKEGGKSIVYAQENGLLEAIAPVKINDTCLYHVMLGEFVHRCPTGDTKRLKHTPVIPEEMLENHLELLTKQVESVIWRQFEKYKHMFTLAPDEMCTLDSDGYVLECNQTFFQKTGFSKEEIVGKHMSELPIFYPEDIDKLLSLHEYLVHQDAPSKHEINWRRKDGSHAVSEIHVTPIDTQGGGKNFHVIAREITDRKEWERKISENEATLHSIFKAAPIGIGMVSERKISWINDNLCRITGYESHELLGKNARLLYPNETEYRRVGAEKYDQISRDGIGTVETQWIRKDGKILDILLSSVPRDPEVSTTHNVIFTALDITDRKEKDRALQESEEKYRNIIESIPLGMHMYALNEEGQLLFSGNNQAANKILGLDNNQFIGKTIEDAFPPSVEAGLPDIYRWVAQTGTSYNLNQVDYQGDEIKGAFEVHAFQTSPNQMVAAFQDITQKMREEQERKLLALAVEQTDECIIITDRHANIQYVNPSFERITGYSPEEVQSRHINILSSDLHDDSFYQKVMNTLKRGEVWSGHMQNRKKDSTPYKAKVTISPIKDKEDKITHYVTLLRDVTIEHKIEEQMRQTQKLEAIGTLAAGIAHEFNNILSSIIGYTELSELSLNKPEKLQNNFNRILNAGERARKLVQQILWFSRKTDFQPRPVKLDNLVQEVGKFMKASLPRSIEFNYHLNAPGSMVFADPNQIHHVLMNICTNAAQAMKERSGNLDIHMRAVEPESAKDSGYPGVAPGPLVQLSITDTGPGIDKETVKRIFEPFFSTKEENGSSGLGLSVAHGIIKNHGGEITVESEPGRGTTFHIFLPRIQQGDEESMQQLETLPRGAETILCIDSQEEVKGVLRNILENLGYRVITAGGSEEALQMLRDQGTSIDLMITGQALPKSSGIQLATEAKELQPDLPVILCTGYNKIELNDQLKDAGVDFLLPKPVTFSKIAYAVRKVLDDAPS
jgi:PAS domain S-box-containing protein